MRSWGGYDQRMATKPLDPPGAIAKATSAEIRAEMARLRVTGHELARAIGKSQNFLAKRLRDELPFTINEVDSIAIALGTTYERLMRSAIERTRQ